MENRLFEYMNRRIVGDFIPDAAITNAGPVITISRQTGCGASRIAWETCEELNKRSPQKESNYRKWNFINREILQQSAEQLNIDPITLKHVLNDKDRGIMDQIVEALSSHSHKSDHKILKTVQEVIRRFGTKGNVIIVGRGGASICKDITRSLHIRIEAPLEWRIDEVARRMDFSKAFAKEYVHKHDVERELLVTKLLGGKPDNLYDMEFNRSSFNEKEIAHAILQIAAIKGLI